MLFQASDAEIGPSVPREHPLQTNQQLSFHQGTIVMSASCVRGMRNVLAASIVALIAASAQAQTAEEVVAKSIKAQGGKEALLSVKALERKGDVNVDGSFGQMQGTVEEKSIPGKKALRALDLAVFQQKDGYNGKTAWREGMDGIREIDGPEADQIKQATTLNPFLAGAEADAKLEKLDDETVDGTAYYVLQITRKDRPPVKFFIDKANDLIKRMTLKQMNEQFGEVEITVETSDYDTFGNVKLPKKNKLSLGEALTVETIYTDTKVNGDIDEKVFDVPKPAEEPKKEEEKKEEAKK